MGKEKVPREKAEAVAAEIMRQLGDFCVKWQNRGFHPQQKDASRNHA